MPPAVLATGQVVEVREPSEGDDGVQRVARFSHSTSVPGLTVFGMVVLGAVVLGVVVTVGFRSRERERAGPAR
ncbi:hypothetical protein JCM4814A_78370 [Streptomyces phaeofaciens JCM 4814]|uniref:Uncharacterized protein n=1 Tax=Streptomyces phaeofaciens TaxID=68254 RepID=A0A918M1Q9_9ACTN|nr:hypothetical protein GCM10010226_90100 [Streptomyces phaeofaciens]